MDNELKEILVQEREIYIGHYSSWKQRFLAWFSHDEPYEIYRYITALRKSEYYQQKHNVRLAIWYGRIANKRGNRLGYFIPGGCLGKGVRLLHKGSIIINHRARIGEGCIFHGGGNCVGNNGSSTDCPVLGKNVDVGIGAKIIGGVYIADDIKIGANAVVTKSFYEKGIVIAGVPARKI